MVWRTADRVVRNHVKALNGENQRRKELRSYMILLVLDLIPDMYVLIGHGTWKGLFRLEPQRLFGCHAYM